ncbi:MAG: DUF4214 domain-containing protein [Desulfobacterales bacterium]|nr:MAG: DUF4214 domain-containing protein [Desulfobacterales bacterium]
MRLRIWLLTTALACMAVGLAYADQTTDTISNYYICILDRDPDLAGLEGWQNEIMRMASLDVDVKEGFIALAKFFFNAEEYQLQNKTNGQYVSDLYQTFFNRAPDQAGWEYWVGLLEQGLSRNVILNFFVYSDEFKLYMQNLYGGKTGLPECNLVNDFYRGLQDRLPDSAGFRRWVAWMRDAMYTSQQAVRDLAHQIALGFVQSPEYALRARSDHEFLEDLYNGILRRGAQKEEFDGWLEYMRTGMTREQILQEFTNSAEFQLRVQETDVNNNWEISSLAAEGFHAAKINVLSNLLRSGHFGNIDCLLIVRNGYLVFEEYYRGYTAETLHFLASVTKSVTSALIGMAMEEGFMDGIDEGGLDQTVLELLPEYASLIKADAAKQNLCLKHILSMSAGLMWEENTYPYSDPRNDWYSVNRSRDSIGYVLQKRAIAEPGTEFNYNSGLTLLLASIIDKNTGMPADLFAAQYLFRPLGIRNYRWSHLGDGLVNTGGGLALQPRDTAKIGYLYTSTGRWRGRPVLSESWINHSVKGRITAYDDGDFIVNYGFKWWLFPLPDASGTTLQNDEIYTAMGSRGQIIFAIPSLDMVVVINSDNEDYIEKVLSILYDHILPAVEIN